MQWFRAHPYLDAIIGATALLIVGTLIVNERSAVSPSSPEAWGGGAIPLLNPYTPQNGTQNTTQNPPISSPSLATETLPTIPTPPLPSSTVAQREPDSFDFNAFMSMLSTTATQNHGSVAASSSASTNAYAYIPTGLVSIQTPKKRTDLQQKLYEYGNEVGSYIQSFEDQNPDEAGILKNQIEDRNNPDKIAAVQALAAGLQQVGKSIAGIDTTPTQMVDSQKRLAQSYITIGTTLALVPQTQRDSDFVVAIQNYDSAADVFTKNYVAMAQLFGAYGVTFQPSDAGSVFTFTNASL
jgi:hypothetical protein